MTASIGSAGGRGHSEPLPRDPTDQAGTAGLPISDAPVNVRVRGPLRLARWHLALPDELIYEAFS